MLTKAQLRKYQKELPLHIIEQDYIEILVLKVIYERTYKLVFKGGTCLRNFYGLDRYSQDLDFTIRKGDPSKIIRKLPDYLLNLGIESELTEKKGRGLLFKLQYKGPLYTGRPITKGKIEIDLSKREDVFLKPKWKVGRPRYPEVITVRALCLKEEEILAEKIRALSQRKQPRDLYDIWFLKELGINVRKKLVENKLEIIGIKRIEKEVLNKFSEEDYQRDLKNLVINPPSFSEVFEVVKRTLSSLRK